MKRPRTWLDSLLFVCLVIVLGEYLALMWLVPRFVVRKLEQLANGKVLIGRAHLSFPFTTTLTGLRLVTNTPEAALSIQRVVISPRWVSLPTKTVWVDTLELERPLLRLTRAADGVIRWPSVTPRTASAAHAAPAPGVRSLLRWPFIWRIRVGSLKISDAIIEFIDERPSVPFHGALDHLSIIAGPVVMPVDRSDTNLSFAVRGEVVGASSHVAPAYCSGWLEFATRNFEASCQLEPLALAAFDPYFHGAPEVRVYTTTLRTTSHWSARSRELTGRLQLELSDLSEGDLSIHGRTIIDLKKLSGGQEPRLTAEVSLTGPLDDPSRWRAALLPGDDRVQHLVARLLERGVERIRLRPLGKEVYINITPSSQATMTDIAAASKEIQEALEILALPIPEAAPAVAAETAVPEASTPEAPASAEASPPVAPSESAGSSSPDAPSSSPSSLQEPADQVR